MFLLLSTSQYVNLKLKGVQFYFEILLYSKNKTCVVILKIY